MASNNRITQHIQALPSGPKVGAFFDFDGTVIDGFSAFISLREQLRKGYISPRNFFDLVAAMVNYRNGMSNFTELMAVGAEVLKGVDEDQYERFSQVVQADYVIPKIYPEARALIEAHQAKGHTVAIVSSATPYQLEHVARELGIEHVYCSRYEVIDGKFSGELDGEPCYGDQKVRAIEALAKTNKINFANSCFYSDGDEDAPALERVGFPRVLNPNDKLQAIAAEKNWPVQVFARTGKPKVFDYLRSVGVYGSLLGSYFAGLGVWKLNGSKEEAQRFMLSMFTDVAFASIRLKLNVRNRANLLKAEPVVVIFNHQSQADGLVMMKLLRDNFAAVGKKELGRFKLFAKAYNFAGIIPIDRANAKNAIEAMQPLVDALSNGGRNVVIAPEGTRSEGHKPGPFKKGAFHVALQAGVPILPIVLHNALDIQPKGEFAYRAGVIDVDILEPVDTSTWTVDTLDDHIAETRNLFLTALGYDEEPLPSKQKVAAPIKKKAASKPKKVAARKRPVSKKTPK